MLELGEDLADLGSLERLGPRPAARADRTVGLLPVPFHVLATSTSRRDGAGGSFGWALAEDFAVGAAERMDVVAARVAGGTPSGSGVAVVIAEDELVAVSADKSHVDILEGDKLVLRYHYGNARCPKASPPATRAATTSIRSAAPTAKSSPTPTRRTTRTIAA